MTLSWSPSNRVIWYRARGGIRARCGRVPQRCGHSGGSLPSAVRQIRLPLCDMRPSLRHRFTVSCSQYEGAHPSVTDEAQMSQIKRGKWSIKHGATPLLAVRAGARNNPSLKGMPLSLSRRRKGREVPAQRPSSSARQASSRPHRRRAKFLICPREGPQISVGQLALGAGRAFVVGAGWLPGVTRRSRSYRSSIQAPTAQRLTLKAVTASVPMPTTSIQLAERSVGQMIWSIIRRRYRTTSRSSLTVHL